MSHWFLIGCLQDGARKTALLENNNLVSHYYNEAKTLYEVFQRGLKVSGDGSLSTLFSKSILHLVKCFVVIVCKINQRSYKKHGCRAQNGQITYIHALPRVD